MEKTVSTPEFSHRFRSTKVAELTRTPAVFDAVIIGGGIVGAGLARELALRGTHCLLVEKGDFASGTSSKSSKLIHGGLRYLEMLHFHLVFESLAERHWLLTEHPHLVTPLEFNLPIYSRKHAPKKTRSESLLRMGLWLYDSLALNRTPFKHGRYSRDEVLKKFPNLRSQGLEGSLFYADAMMMDDELVLETIYDAFKRGAVPLNYIKAVSVSEKENGLYEVFLQDTLKTDAKPFHVRAREVIVCVGPWTEQFGENISGGAGRKLKPSRGVHLVIPFERMPIDGCIVMYAPDGRIIFAIPRKDLGPGAECVIVGTTDSPETRDMDEITAQKQDVEYLLNVLNTYFPGSKFSQEDISTTYAGVRPLLDEGDKSEATTSREHEIWRNKAGIVFMAGGKYTTFRKISQEIADFAFPYTGTEEVDSKRPLSLPNEYQSRMSGTPLWGRFTEGWVHWKLTHHAPCTLEDVVFRRMPLWMGGRNLSPKVIDRVAQISAEYFGWNSDELQKQKKILQSSIQKNLQSC